MLTTSAKIRIETAQYNRLFKDILIALGKSEGECKIEILGMSTMEASNLEERMIMKYQAGLLPRAWVIAKLEKISMEEAEELSKKIEAEEKIKMEYEQSMQQNKGVNNNAKGGSNG